MLGRPGADAVVVDDGRITAVGRSTELDQPGVGRVELGDGVLTGALRDAHIHPGGYASAVTGLSVGDAADFGDLRERIFSSAMELLPGAPVVANRLDEHRLLEGRLPTRRDLDAILENRPIFAMRYCGHVATASSSALRRAGITATTPDPPGGTIDRDESGEPTGILRETAVGLVSAALATEVSAPSPERLIAAISGLAGLGIGRIDAIVSTGSAMWCSSEDELDDLLAVAPDLPIPIRCFTTASTPAELERAAARIRQSSGDITWAGWKAFADGSLGGLTAAMDEPFTDHPGTGALRLDRSSDDRLAEATLDLGGTVAIHAIGDRANRAVIEMYRSLRGGWADPARFRVEHASVLSEQLVTEFASTGLTASVQPAFITSEADWLLDRIGADRARWTYPLRSLFRAGVPLVAGSDSPVEDPDPWKAMAAACHNPITPDESLDRTAALAIFGSAPLAVGAAADIILIDRNPLTTDDLAATKVLATFISGERVDARPLAWPG